MANPEHLEILKQGVEAWNQWRKVVPEVFVDLIEADLFRVDLTGGDLTGADLRGVNLSKADLYEANLSVSDLRGANLHKADLSEADLIRANLTGADLRGANLHKADLFEANLSVANLSLAYLVRANLTRANLSRAILNNSDLSKADLFEANITGAHLYRSNLSLANLTGANLSKANMSKAYLIAATLGGADLRGVILREADITGSNLVNSNLERADLRGCRVYGVSAWNVNLKETIQKDLVITNEDEPKITVDDLRIAQFIYLLLDNEQIRDVIDTITSKAVLILGRFTNERKQVLDALREELRKRNYLPILFDFEKPANRDFTETVMTLASMSKFIIADITNPKSSPLELQATIPNFMTPFVPIIQEGESPFSMFKDLWGKHNWVIDLLEYDSVDTLIQVIEPAVISPALRKSEELTLLKAKDLVTRHASDYLEDDK